MTMHVYASVDVSDVVEHFVDNPDFMFDVLADLRHQIEDDEFARIVEEGFSGLPHHRGAIRLLERLADAMREAA